LSERPGRWCAWRLGGDSRLCAGRGYTSQLTLAVRRKPKLAGRPGGDAGRTPGEGGIAAQPGERGASAPRWKRCRRTPGSHALRAGGCGSPQTVELPGLRGAGRVSRARHGYTSQLTLAVRRKPKLAGRPGGDAGRTPGGAALLRNQANVGRQPLGGSAANAPPGRMPCGPVAAGARKPLNCRGLRGAGRVSRARHGDTSQLTLAVRRPLAVGCLAAREGSVAG